MNTKVLAFLFLGVVAVLVYPKGANGQQTCSELKHICELKSVISEYIACMKEDCTDDRDDLDFEDREIPDDSSFDTLDGDRNPDGKSG